MHALQWLCKVCTAKLHTNLSSISLAINYQATLVLWSVWVLLKAVDHEIVRINLTRETQRAALCC